MGPMPYGAVVCLAALAAACSGRDRAADDSEDVRETPAAQTPATTSGDPASTAMDTQTSAEQQPGAPTQGADSAGGKKGSGRAGEIARAPRGNPNAPPRPKLTPDKPGTSDTTPTQPDSTPKSDESKGTTESAGQPVRDKYHAAPRDTVSPVVYTGWKYFNLNCARCHGEDVTGTTIAPHLIDSFKSGKVDHAEYWRVVHGSRAERGMPNWSGLVDDDKLQAIYEYGKGRSDGKLHPGRPAQQGS
jgi:hypothetical protein